MSADIKLELDTEGGSLPPPPEKLPSHVYHPRHALRSAVSAWLPEFQKQKAMWGPITKPQVGLNPMGLLQPSVNTCITSTPTTSSVNLPLPCTSVPSANPPSPKHNGQAAPSPWPSLPGPLVTPMVAPMLIPVMNSLVSQNEVRPSPLLFLPSPFFSKVVLERPEPAEQALKAGPPEPMDDTPPSPQAMESTTNPPTPGASAELSSPPTPAAMQVEVEGLSKAESTTMLCESAGPGPPEEPGPLCEEDLELICDLFYLPCEHGPKVAGSSTYIANVLTSNPGPGLSERVLLAENSRRLHAEGL
jgi:hypothetical protein